MTVSKTSIVFIGGEFKSDMFDERELTRFSGDILGSNTMRMGLFANYSYKQG